MLRFLYRWRRSERVLSRSACWHGKVSSQTSWSRDPNPVRFGGQRSLEIILELWREMNIDWGQWASRIAQKYLKLSIFQFLIENGTFEMAKITLWIDFLNENICQVLT